jgi:hypothetical protein
MTATRLPLLLALLLLATSFAASLATPGSLGETPSADDPAENANELCIIFITVENASFNSVEVIVDRTLNESEFAAIADEVDGDDDGNITLEEISVWENATVELIPGYQLIQQSNLSEYRLFVDWSAPENLTTWKRLHRFEGETNQSNPTRLVQEMREYTFISVAYSDFHRLEGGIYSPIAQVVEEVVVVTAPDGWIVWAANDRRVEGRPQVTTLTGFDTEYEYSLEFATVDYIPPEPSKPNPPDDSGFGLPAAGVSALLCAVGLALLASRKCREE